MDKVMAFLQEKFGAFFAWWKDLTQLSTIDYGKFSVNWPIVVFTLLLIGGFMILVGIFKAF